MKTVAFHTLGCKVNQYETEALINLFKENDFEILNDNEVADVYVINTCTVTNIGNKKSRQFIRKVKKINPNSLVAVVGCYSQIEPKEVENISGVNIVLGTNNREKLIDIINSIKKDEVINNVEDIMNESKFEKLKIDKLYNKTRAFVKVQEGCNQYCSYCIIPYARGNIRSRDIEEAFDEIKSLVENGFREIVLTGIHISSYGKDLKEEDYLIKLIERINKLDGLDRIRLSSIEPRWLKKENIDRLKNIEKLCPHFHLSLQSGSNKILNRMNRKYTSEEYENTINLLRNTFKSPAITTDIIVGFPNEDESDFLETYNFLERIKFNEVHVFKYSPKKGTKAANMEGQIDGKIKNKRSNQLINLTDSIKHDYLENKINSYVEVLFEEEVSQNIYTGYTKDYFKVRIESKDKLINKIKKVKITGVKNGILEASFK